jgi:hypothetical protein
MNLMSFLQRGATHAPTDAQRRQAKYDATANAARQMWLDALLVDQTRAWMSIGEDAPDILGAMATMLTIGGMVHVYDKRTEDTPDMRVIRGAISAATQRAQSKGVITTDDVRAFAAGCERAVAAIREGSTTAIIHAAQSIRVVVGLEGVR